MEKVEKIVIEKAAKLCDKTLSEFSEALSSSAPTPGGGGAAAYTAALGLSCGEMVCNLTLGKEKYADVHAELETMKKDLEAMRTYLIKMVDEDAKAYKPLQKVLSGDKSEPGYIDHLEAALRVACEIPTEVMYTSARAIELYAVLAEKGAKSVISDVGAGVELCKAAMLASQQCILTNAVHMADDVFGMTLKLECEKVQAQFLPVAEKALATVAERIK